MDPRDLQHILALYDGEIRYMDEHVGALTGRHHAELTLHPHGDRVVLRGARDRLEWRQPELVHEHLELAGVPVPVGSQL